MNLLKIQNQMKTLKMLINVWIITIDSSKVTYVKLYSCMKSKWVIMFYMQAWLLD